MRMLSWVILFLIYSGYLIIGGVIFHSIECPHEEEQRKEEFELKDDIMNLTTTLDGQDRETLEKVLKRYISTEFPDESVNVSNKGRFIWTVFQEDNENQTIDCPGWDHVNSVFFSFTVVTTIGEAAQ